MRILSILLVLSISACGAEKDNAVPVTNQSSAPVDSAEPAAETPGSTVAETSHRSMLVQDAAALPACDAAGEGWLIYVKSLTQFQTCAAGAWEVVAISPVVQPNSIEKSWLCQSSIDLDSSAEQSEVMQSAKIIKFANGDYVISCMDSYSNSDFLDSDQSSGIEFFPASLASAMSGKLSCLAFHLGVTFDVATGVATVNRNGESDNLSVTCTGG